jgi:hypothetical protein
MRAWVLVGLGLLAVAACGDPAARAPSSTAEPSTTSTATTAGATTTAVAASRHFTHDQLAAALPSPAQLSWLPADATVSDDYDLTSTLSSHDCSGAKVLVGSNEAAAANRAFQSASHSGADGSLAYITYYDVNDLADARSYVDMLRAFATCSPPASAKVTLEVLEPGPSRCAASLVVLAHQPVGITIDGWCRVGNLVGWIRLYPTSKPPTAAQADQTLTAVGDRLTALLGS